MLKTGVAALLGLLPVGAAAAPAGGFDPPTVTAIDRALGAVNLSLADLGWDKRPIDDDFRLAVVDRALDRPLDLAEVAERAERELAGDPKAVAAAAARWLDLAEPALAPLDPARSRFAGAPAGIEPLLALLVAGYRDARRLHRQALAPLDAGERRLVDELGARIYLDESEEEWDMTALLAAAKKVDLAALAAAEARLAWLAAEVRRLAPAAATASGAGRTWLVDGVRVALGSTGDDRHTAEVVLDPGGNDRFEGGQLVVDLGGDDTYRDSGSGRLRVALLLDLGGDDRYLGGDLIQGGAAFGASLLVDVAGDDRYEATQCAQGAGYFGFGLLLDLAGNDAYRGARFVQGFGGSRGLGALVDHQGADTYWASGTFPHVPLLPDSFQSLSQGFGFGLRGASASGGVGVLVDRAGNDVYSAEVFGQGASYWFALGVLVDSAGNDKYDLFQYGQGAGIHLSPAVLLDRAGSDAYSCNNGVAQGSGHDWGVGLLWDQGGNDCYQGSGMSQGGANANGVGMLVDRSGNDSYAGWNVKNQGDSFFARGTIGLGLLLDLDGADRYDHGGHDDTTWTRGTVGVGMDTRPAGEAAP